MGAAQARRALGDSPLVQRLLPRLAWWLAEAAALFGEEERPDRAASALVLRLPPPGEADLLLLDRRGEAPRSYRFAAGLDDLAERLAAVRGAGRAPVGVKLLVPPAACFQRTLTLPATVLPRMREVLDRELEAATPFRAASVHADWFVEGEDAAGRLVVRHCVIKRSALDPLLATLSAAGLRPGPVAVGTEEDRTLPVDLLSGGRRALPRRLGALRAGDLLLLGLALFLLLAAALPLWRAHQAATLDALDAATAAARRTAPARLPPAVLAAALDLAAARAARPPVAVIWDSLARALPDPVSAESLRVDAAGLTLTLRAPDPAAALAALPRLDSFGPPRREAAPDPEHVVVVLPPGRAP
ncbi:hypothetical protein [Methylobacterium sp. JK268]